VKLVVVVWTDACLRSDWSLGVDFACAVMTTVGWLVAEDDDTIAVASEQDTKNPTDFRGVTSIPKVNVLSIDDQKGGD
jgi:hypothetical protein